MRLLIMICTGLVMLLAVPMRAGIKYNRPAALPTFGGYFPPVVEKVGALSDHAAVQLQSWLRKTFSEAAQKQLELRRSCIVPASMKIDTEIRYSVIAAILVNHEAIDFYEFRIDMREDGTVLNEPEIPRLDRDGLPIFASWPAITEAFKKAGVPDLDDSVYLDYSEKTKAAVWRSVRFEKATLGRRKVTTISILAEDGRVIERTEGIVP